MYRIILEEIKDSGEDMGQGIIRFSRVVDHEINAMAIMVAVDQQPPKPRKARTPKTSAVKAVA